MAMASSGPLGTLELSDIGCRSIVLPLDGWSLAISIFSIETCEVAVRECLVRALCQYYHSNKRNQVKSR